MRNPIGTHVLVGKGLVAGALATTREVGYETLQIFVGNPRGWALPAGKPEEDASFRTACEESGIRSFIHTPIHAPYLVNLGPPTRQTFENSVASVAHTLRRAAEIGAEGVVVHTGSFVDPGDNDSMDVRGAFRYRHGSIGDGHIGEAAFRELFAHPETDGVPFILETPGSRDPGNADLAALRRLREAAREVRAPS